MTASFFRRLALTFSLLLCVVLVSTATAQTTAASLTGTIRDSTGSILPGATVLIVNDATATVAWNGVTDEHGNYLALSVPPGTYDVTVSLQGFKSASIRGVRLEISQRARLAHGRAATTTSR